MALAGCRGTASTSDIRGGRAIAMTSQAASVPAASPGEFPPLRLGPHVLTPPVLSAPMAGISCAPYRLLAEDAGAVLCFSEMLVASTINDRAKEAMRLAKYSVEERGPRAAQLYGVDPSAVRDAAEYLVHEAGAQVLDLNFGCPVRKVTARGGGAALAVRWRLVGRLVAAAVSVCAPAGVPVTAKLRLGLDETCVTYPEAAMAAQDAGAAAVTLHVRSAVQGYDSPVDLAPLQHLVSMLSIPVIGNGDVFEGPDAVRMMRETGCAGVMIGRGALGRPWLFEEAAACLRGERFPGSPSAADAVATATRHVRGLAEWEGTGERSACMQMRKLLPLYFLGFESARPLRNRLLQSQSLEDWDAAVSHADWDPDELMHESVLRAPRLKGVVRDLGDPKPNRKVALPPL